MYHERMPMHVDVQLARFCVVCSPLLAAMRSLFVQPFGLHKSVGMTWMDESPHCIQSLYIIYGRPSPGFVSAG